ncbi:alkaline phosphatase family protein [bacterium]|nr:alkaline phosphatase family protein [bacterium]
MIKRRSHGLFCVLVCIYLLLSACERNAQQTPLVLLGLDGASWKFIDPLLERGALPTFQRLIDQGGRGNLETLLPTQSVIIWNTIVTGCMPEKHGIKGWLSGAGDQLALTSTMRQKPALWDILSSKKKKGLYVNWWSSWPVYPISGVMVSNLFFYRDAADPVYPTELTTELRSLISSAEIDQSNQSHHNAALASAAYRKDEQIFELAGTLLERDQYDMVAVYVRGLDLIEHEYYQYAFPEEFSRPIPDREEFQGFIDDYYMALDSLIQKFLARFTSTVDVIIVSDHGMEAMSGESPPISRLLLNTLLQELGYCSIKDQYDLDWSQTKVYQYGYHIPGPIRTMRINVIGREKQGVVPASEQEMVASQIMTLLSSLTAKRPDQTGVNMPLFTEVSRATDDEADLFCRLNLDLKPDDILELPGGNQKVDSFLTHFLLHSSGQHDQAPPGIVIVSGPSFTDETRLSACHVTDIAPTILQVMGLPLSEEMDGCVLVQGLTRAKKRAITGTVTSYPLPEGAAKNSETGGDRLPQSIEKKVRTELQSLGYIQ